MSNVFEINEKVDENQISVSSNKSFKCYHDLPAELRMMVVDEMQPDDRCRFTRCSVLSSIEAKNSNNYMYSLKLFCFRKNFVRITVKYDGNSKCGFYLEFLEDFGKMYMKCLSIQWEKLWSTELPGSTDLVQFAAQRFKSMLRDYQHIIKKLVVHDDMLSNFDFEFRNLNNLEWLDMSINSSILPAISKLRKPLKNLVILGEENTRELESYEEFKISKISEQIWLPHLKLNYEQFLQLSASNVSIHIGEINEENICEIIKFWQTDCDDKKIYYEWNLEDSKFDLSKLLRILGADKETNPNKDEEVLMDIKHGFEEAKTAQLSRIDENLTFQSFFRFQAINQNH